MDASPLSGGFVDHAVQSATAFRALLQAMARPGLIFVVNGAEPPAPLSIAAGVAVLTLCDADTMIYLAPSVDNDDIRAWIAFHTGAPFASSRVADFAIGKWDELIEIKDFPSGNDEYPDRSATLICALPALATGKTRLTGPGIKGVHWLNLPDGGDEMRRVDLYPCGRDLILTAGDQLAALPRKIRLEAG